MSSFSERREVSAEGLEMYSRNINQPGTVQSFGCVLMVDAASMRCVVCSSNTEQLLGRDQATVLDQTVANLFKEANELEMFMSHVREDPVMFNAHPMSFMGDRAPVSLIVHKVNKKYFLVDVEPAQSRPACLAGEDGDEEMKRSIAFIQETK
jgi:light-regulated signal transduction histidine kinase (bacteriophytochrome)